MNCPKCNTEIVKGFLSKDNNYWLDAKAMLGQLKQAVSLFIPFGPRVIAFKCPKCGKIELQIETEQ